MSEDDLPESEAAPRGGRTGRPTKYTAEIGERICLLIIEGKSLRKICRRSGMPAYSTLCNWLNKQPEFVLAYAQAKEFQALLLAEETLEIADDTSEDFVTKTRDDGSTYEVLDREHVERSKVRIGTRQWLIERMNPKRFGARVTNEHVGKDNGPIQMKMSENEIARRIAYTLMKYAPKPAATESSAGNGTAVTPSETAPQKD